MQQQEYAKNNWVKKFQNQDDDFKWDPVICKLMNESMDLISWDDYTQRQNAENGVWTLVHGDYHPGNQLYNYKNNELTTVDWELIGFGSGP